MQAGLPKSTKLFSKKVTASQVAEPSTIRRLEFRGPLLMAGTVGSMEHRCAEVDELAAPSCHCRRRRRLTMGLDDAKLLP